MTVVGVAILASGVIGAGAEIYSANKAAGAQSQAIGQAERDIQQGQSQALGALTKYLGPYAQFGQSLQPTLQSLLTPGPSQTTTLQQLPGFQFARDLAGYGISAGAGARGISGTTAVEGGNLESQIASGYFSNYVNPLLSLYGQSAGAAGQAGQSAANIFTGGAQSLAGLAVGQGNVQAGRYGTIGSVLGGLGGSAANAALIAKLTGGGGLNANYDDPTDPTGSGAYE